LEGVTGPAGAGRPNTVPPPPQCDDKLRADPAEGYRELGGPGAPGAL